MKASTTVENLESNWAEYSAVLKAQRWAVLTVNWTVAW